MTLVAKSNGRFVTLEEDTAIIKADKKEAFGWFVRELWNLKQEKNGFTLESWNKDVYKRQGETGDFWWTTAQTSRYACLT